MIEMILPDGSKRQLENPMTVVEFAKSIGSSLGKATVGAVIEVCKLIHLILLINLEKLK